MVKSLSANEGDAWDSGSIPGSWRSPGGGHDNPIQYFWLENLMVREAWWVVVHGVAKSQTWLKRLGHTCRFLHFPLSFEFSKQASASGLWHFPLSLPGILFQSLAPRYVHDRGSYFTSATTQTLSFLRSFLHHFKIPSPFHLQSSSYQRANVNESTWNEGQALKLIQRCALFYSYLE